MADYNLEFDTKEDLFGCENGVIDLAEECFRPYQFDDYITFSCGYDFRPLVFGFTVKSQDGTSRKIVESDLTPEDASAFEKLMEIYGQIHPDVDVLKYFFIINSTALTGKAIEKLFIYNGEGRNGKGLHDEFMEVVIGTYFQSVSPIIFSEDQKKKTSSGANPEIAKLDKMRYVVMKEPQKDAPFHNSVIKDYTGGGNTQARMLYSSKTTVKLCLTAIVECNEKPPFSEAPKDADIERIVDIYFGSKFVLEESEWDINTGETNHIYPLNVLYKERAWRDAHKNAMLNILLERVLFLKNDGQYIVDKYKPESVKQRSLAYLQNSYDIHNIFSTLFERRNEENADRYVNYKGNPSDEDWTLAKIAQKIRQSSEFHELSKAKQKEYKADTIETFFRKNTFYKSSVYTNTKTHSEKLKDWRLKPSCADSDDEGDS
jgi:phage/plasmid-associated DNA primase